MCVACFGDTALVSFLGVNFVFVCPLYFGLKCPLVDVPASAWGDVALRLYCSLASVVTSFGWGCGESMPALRFSLSR